MKIQPTDFPGVLLFEPRVFADPRGLFLETFNAVRYRDAGLETTFVQDNHSCSRRGVLRGLHYQIEHPQGKLIWAVRGAIFDVVVDLRRRSPQFGRWMSVILSEENRRQLYVPPGLAHGFCALDNGVHDDDVQVNYKCTDYYHPAHERTIVWSDPGLAIDWPIESPIVSEKDRQGVRFSEAPVFDDL